jgi:cytochrome c oxidase subunit 4
MENTPAHTSSSHTRTYYIVFGVLLALLAATVGINELPLGGFAFPAAAIIATAKAVLILLFFMHVWHSRPLTWLAAGAGFVWLAILFGLAFTDYAIRSPGP